jgi:protein-tyrosine-phosphatase
MAIPDPSWFQLAEQSGVPLHATSGGTEPDAEVSPAVVALLRTEGIDVADHRPRRVMPEELARAHLDQMSVIKIRGAASGPLAMW